MVIYMIVFEKYASVISKMIIGGEEMLNLCELLKCIEEDKVAPEIEECIIMPYYINGSSRYELYQYEFCIEQKEGEPFEKYMQRITGKELEDIPNNVIRVRQICYLRIDENRSGSTRRKIIDYFNFLISDECVQQEIVGVFSEFNPDKLFVCVY